MEAEPRTPDSKPHAALGVYRERYSYTVQKYSSERSETHDVQNAALLPPAERSPQLPPEPPRSKRSRGLPEAAARGGAAARRRHLAAPVQVDRRRQDGPLPAAACPRSPRRAEAGVPGPRRRLPAPSESRPSGHGAWGSCNGEGSGVRARPPGHLAPPPHTHRLAPRPGRDGAGAACPTVQEKASPRCPSPVTHRGVPTTKAASTFKSKTPRFHARD